MTTTTDPPVEPPEEPQPSEPEGHDPVLPTEPYPPMALDTDTLPTVNQTIVMCMRDIGAVAKSRYNEGQKFNFRGIDQFLNACHGVMAKHGLTIVPSDMQHTLEARERFRDGQMQGYSMHVVNKVRWEAEGPAGDKKYFTTVGEAADSADKATNKSISAAEKYMLISVFKIPTEDIAEGDSDHPDTGSRRPTQGASRQASGSSPTSSAGTGAKPSEKQMAAMGALATEVIGTNTKQIKAVMMAITERVSTRTQMSRQEASKVIDTLKQVQAGDKVISYGPGDETAKIYGKDEEPFEGTGEAPPEGEPS